MLISSWPLADPLSGAAGNGTDAPLLPHADLRCSASRGFCFEGLGFREVYGSGVYGLGSSLGTFDPELSVLRNEISKRRVVLMFGNL